MQGLGGKNGEERLALSHDMDPGRWRFFPHNPGDRGHGFGRLFRRLAEQSIPGEIRGEMSIDLGRLYAWLFGWDFRLPGTGDTIRKERVSKPKSR